MSYLAALNSGSIEAIDAVVAVDVNLAEVLLSGNSAGSSILNMNNNSIINCNNISSNTTNAIAVYNNGTGGIALGGTDSTTNIAGKNLKICMGSSPSYGTAGQVLTSDGANASWVSPAVSAWGQKSVAAVGVNGGALGTFPVIQYTGMPVGTYLLSWSPIINNASSNISFLQLSINNLTYYFPANNTSNLSSFAISVPVVITSAGTLYIQAQLYNVINAIWTPLTFLSVASTIFYQKIA